MIKFTLPYQPAKVPDRNFTFSNICIVYKHLWLPPPSSTGRHGGRWYQTEMGCPPFPLDRYDIAKPIPLSTYMTCGDIPPVFVYTECFYIGRFTCLFAMWVVNLTIRYRFFNNCCCWSYPARPSGLEYVSLPQPWHPAWPSYYNLSLGQTV